MVHYHFNGNAFRRFSGEINLARGASPWGPGISSSPCRVAWQEAVCAKRSAVWHFFYVLTAREFGRAQKCGRKKLFLLTALLLLTLHSQEWSFLNFPCSLIRNITSHNMKNLAFHRLPEWKLIVHTNSHYLAYVFLFRKVGRMYFLNLRVKGLTDKPATCCVYVGITHRLNAKHWLPPWLIHSSICYSQRELGNFVSAAWRSSKNALCFTNWVPSHLMLGWQFNPCGLARSLTTQNAGRWHSVFTAGEWGLVLSLCYGE